MASFKMNLATLDNCPSTTQLVEAMDKYGIPEDGEFAVLDCIGNDDVARATIVYRGSQAVNALDEEAGEVVARAVEKATKYPIAIFPGRGVLEIYEGTASGFDHIAAFFASELALPIVVTPIEIDIPAVIEKLQTQVNKFQLRGAKINDYAHSSYMSGPYTPKFLDSASGLEFIQEYVEQLASASVKFRGDHGLVSVSLASKACFSYSVKDEDDKPAVQAILRKLI